jgi:hypothetical protein
MAKVPPGGPATINGVLYQMLWSLLRAVKLQTREYVADAFGQPSRAILILEPIGGGGDLQRVEGPKRAVEQLKADSSRGTWSLTDVVRDVLPDLYLAVDDEFPDTVFRFVTEGKIGRWNSVYEFFRSLESRPLPPGDVLGALDYTTELKFQRRRSEETSGGNGEERAARIQPFWGDQPHSERTLFELIATRVRDRERVREEEAELTRRKLWRMLGRFEFCGNQTAERLRREIDRFLVETIDATAKLEDKRGALLMDLAEQASAGSATIEAQAFFEKHGLNATRLSDLARLRLTSQRLLERSVHLLGYSSAEDVRADRIRSIAAQWTADKPILALKGGSGAGKSWLLAGTGLEMTATSGSVVVLESTGDAHSDQQRASDVYWQDIKGNNDSISLGRLAIRTSESVENLEAGWLAIMIDGVQSTREARCLVQQDWETRRMKLAISCSEEVADTIERVAGRRRCLVVEVGDFSAAELACYLTEQLGEDWPDIPEDVRRLLRRPLMARLYRDIAQRGRWRPTNEYSLLAAYWDRLRQGEQAEHPSDIVGLRQLAMTFVRGAPYPWTEQQVVGAGLDDEAVSRLVRVGFLRRLSDGRYAVWHDRLFSWAVADALVSSVESGDIATAELSDRVREITIAGGSSVGRVRYVPADVIWFLADPSRSDRDWLERVIEGLERLSWLHREEVLVRIAPTAGSRIAPMMLRRLGAVAVDRADLTLPDQYVRGLFAIESPEIGLAASQLLESNLPLVRRFAARLLAKRPSVIALDRLWSLHCSALSDPAPYRFGNEDGFFVHHDFTRALTSCVRLAPEGQDWLERAILRANPRTERLSALGYLVAQLNDGGSLWKKVKPTLFEHIAPDGSVRCLATNILKYKDSEEVEWLLSQVPRQHDYVGAVALRALHRIRPDLAIEQLDGLDLNQLYLSRKWCFAELVAMQPEAARARLLGRLRREFAWKVAAVYQESSDDLDVPTLECLLTSLDGELGLVLGGPRPLQSSSLYLPFMIVGGVRRLRLIECLEGWRGTSLEQRLTQWLIDDDSHNLAPAREECMRLLMKICGEGTTDFVNHDLGSSSPHVRFQALEFSTRRPNLRTIAALAQTNQLDDGHPLAEVERAKATLALASLGQWREALASVVRWGEPFGLEARRPAENWQLDESVMGNLLAEFTEAESPSAGQIYALAVGGRRDKLGSVRALLHRCPPVGSDVATACVFALGVFKDDSQDALELLVGQLKVDARQHASKVALSRIGTDNALDALLNHLSINFECPLAATLLAAPRTRDAAIALVKDKLLVLTEYSKLELLCDLAPVVEPVTYGLLFENPTLHEFVRESAFSDQTNPRVETRVAVLRALAYFDADTAFLAGRKALCNGSGPGREGLPRLLVEINAVKAVPILLERTIAERSHAVIWSIGRSLASIDVSEALSSWMDSDDPSERRAACRLAAKVRVNFDLSAALANRVGDPDLGVAREALHAIRALRDARETDAVVSALLAEQDPNRVWVLLDSVVGLCDPGDMDGPLPTACMPVVKVLAPEAQQYFWCQLRARREKLAEEAERLDREDETT